MNRIVYILIGLFVLIHVFRKVKKNLFLEKESFFLDLTTKDNTDSYESEADSFAQEKLISKECWNDILNNYLPLNDDKLIDIGKKYIINPAILLGRVCFEMNYCGLKTKIDKKLE